MVPKIEKYLVVTLLLLAAASVYWVYGGRGNFGYSAQTQPNKQLAALLAVYDAKPVQFDVRTAEVNCHVNGALPDHACTPGAVFPEATKETICVKGYTKSVRNVSTTLKKKVYQEYGFAYPQKTGTFEADHLIPLELGGNNDIANLFPEAADPKPGFHEKDLVENYLNHQVCAGNITLTSAQQQIANDWVAVYNLLTPDQLKELRSEFFDN